MTIARGKTFRSGNSEAVRLPKEVAYGADIELVIVRSGEVTTLYPAAKADLRGMVDRLNALPRPSAIERRDDEELPERPGL
jgi:antitoxin VapB